MNRFRLIIIGFLLTFLSSWIGLVLMPIVTIGNFEQIEDLETGEMIPPKLSDLAKKGKRVYQANGCIYCHSQQVRPARFGTDIERRWGLRRTIAADYAADEGQALLGTMRTGPDLATIGIRNPSRDWNLIHLYNPQTVSPGSNMPPFPFLFKKQKIQGERSPKALPLRGEFDPGEGYEIVPTEDAEALVVYLQSLKFGSYNVPGAERAQIESQAEMTN
ncbi:MAG: cbb3-type cytochrome c oxidase subunit II [Akkermansiaceae bacterium]